MQLFAYLTFAGNCREAMQFYQQCLGGELTFQTVGSTPFAGVMPLKMKECILNATLQHENLLLIASDIVTESGHVIGNSVSLMIDCKSAFEANRCFERLSCGGTVIQPLQKNFYGSLCGNISDRFGVQWMITSHENYLDPA
jgi:PhnB protein